MPRASSRSRRKPATRRKPSPPAPATPTPDAALLTIPETAAYLRISRAHLYSMLDSTISVVRIGRRVLVPRAWLDEWITRQRSVA